MPGARAARPPRTRRAPGRRAGQPGPVAICRSRSWPSSRSARPPSGPSRSARRRPPSSSSPATTSPRSRGDLAARGAAARAQPSGPAVDARAIRDQRARLQRLRDLEQAARPDRRPQRLPTLHSGVFWELHQPLLEDIEQIEVISGPGGTLYGPNAVNGVVSIVTRDAARDARRAGRAAPPARSERTLGAALRRRARRRCRRVRVYGNGFDRDDLPDGRRPRRRRRLSGWQAGFRADFGIGRRALHPPGRLFRQRDRSRCPATATAATICSPAGRAISTSTSSFQVQAYYDHFRAPLPARPRRARDLRPRSPVQSSCGRPRYRRGRRRAHHARRVHQQSRTPSSSIPPSRRLWIFNAFVQDRFALTADAVADRRHQARAILASPGVEVLPNVRLAWQPDAGTCSGRRCRGRCARRRGSTATSPARRPRAGARFPRPRS